MKAMPITVLAKTNVGGLCHIEDYFAVSSCPNDNLKEVLEFQEQAFIGVFDAHGSLEAAQYVKESMWGRSCDRRSSSQDVKSVREAIACSIRSLTSLYTTRWWLTAVSIKYMFY